MKDVVLAVLWATKHTKAMTAVTKGGRLSQVGLTGYVSLIPTAFISLTSIINVLPAIQVYTSSAEI